jgi:hypothetical protein
MSLTPFLVALFAFAAVCALFATGHGVHARRRWRERRRVAATLRLAWCLVFLALALLGGVAGSLLLGYRRLAAEAPVARIEARALGAQRYAVDIATPRAVMLGAQPLYRLERIGGRYRDVAQERSSARTVVALDDARLPDLWTVKRAFPRWLPWVDADYGSAAYLPLVDGGRYDVTLAAAGGLVARPADAATAEKLRADGG